MKKCFIHNSVHAINTCSNCWMNFCSSCFVKKSNVCINCNNVAKKDNPSNIRRSIFAFVILCALFSSTLLGAFLLPIRSLRDVNILNNNKEFYTVNSPVPSNTSPLNKEKFIIKGSPSKTLIESKSEKYFDIIPKLTRLPKSAGFDLSKIKINIFSTKERYLKETGKPSWSEGFANYRKKEIFIVQGLGIEDSMLPHEMSHLFFDSYMGYEDADFNWLDEGVATFVQVSFDSGQAKYFKSAMNRIRNKNHIPLKKLASFSLSSQKTQESVSTFYAQTLSLVDFLMKYDEKSWPAFLKELKNRTDFHQALEDIYQLDINSLEQKWLDYLRFNKQDWES